MSSAESLGDREYREQTLLQVCNGWLDGLDPTLAVIYGKPLVDIARARLTALEQVKHIGTMIILFGQELIEAQEYGDPEDELAKLRDERAQLQAAQSIWAGPRDAKQLTGVAELDRVFGLEDALLVEAGDVESELALLGVLATVQTVADEVYQQTHQGPLEA